MSVGLMPVFDRQEETRWKKDVEIMFHKSEEVKRETFRY